MESNVLVSQSNAFFHDSVCMIAFDEATQSITQIKQKKFFNFPYTSSIFTYQTNQTMNECHSFPHRMSPYFFFFVMLLLLFFNFLNNSLIQIEVICMFMPHVKMKTFVTANLQKRVIFIRQSLTFDQNKCLFSNQKQSHFLA